MSRLVDRYKNSKVIKMGDMKPLEVGEIVGAGSDYCGHKVMRTASVNGFEVIDLSEMKANICWVIKECNLPVRLLGKGETLLLELSNED